MCTPERCYNREITPEMVRVGAAVLREALDLERRWSLFLAEQVLKASLASLLQPGDEPLKIQRDT